MEAKIDEIIREGMTMVPKECFKTVLRHYPKVNKLRGEVVECGVWRGGFSIFLSLLFSDREIWVCDSFEGFQPLEDARYHFHAERHNPDYKMTGFGPLPIDLETVRGNFLHFDLNDKRIHFLKGFVKDTLTPDCGINDIILLRIDVDAYSATLEVLDALYDKVVPGGMIIFDDSCLTETREAIRTFLTSKDLPLKINSPNDDRLLDINVRYTDDDSGLPQSCYIFKQ